MTSLGRSCVRPDFGPIICHMRRHMIIQIIQLKLSTNQVERQAKPGEWNLDFDAVQGKYLCVTQDKRKGDGCSGAVFWKER